MAKELEVTDNTAQDQKTNQKLRGNALKMNDNSAGGKEPARSPALPRQGSGDEPNQQKLQGKALQVNENSVEDHGPARLP